MHLGLLLAIVVCIGIGADARRTCTECPIRCINYIKYWWDECPRCACDPNADLFGDIKLTSRMRNYLIRQLNTDDILTPEYNFGRFWTGQRAATSNIYGRWNIYQANGKWLIPYFIESDVADNIRTGINEAITIYEDLHCFKFVERTDEQYYIHFQSVHTGCWSYVGRVGDGDNTINLGKKCYQTGTILHEIMHALGFFHEHQRLDRNEHIEIKWENIRAEKKLQYDAMAEPYVNSGQFAYDTQSIMHYHDKTFTSNGLPTMTLLGGGKLKTQNQRLSELDKQQIKAMYQCPGAPTTSAPTTTTTTTTSTTSAATTTPATTKATTTSTTSAATTTSATTKSTTTSTTTKATTTPTTTKATTTSTTTKATTTVPTTTATPTTAPSTNMPGCRDFQSGCADWARAGHCSQSAVWMAYNCPLSCGKCGSVTTPTTTKTTTTTTTKMPTTTTSNPITGCKDIRHDCALLTGFCNRDIYVSYMALNCANTCGKCGSGITPKSTTTTTTMPTTTTSASPSGCQDERNCQIITDFCDRSIYVSYMTENCARTCGRCGSGTPKTTTTTTTATTMPTTNPTATPSVPSGCQDEKTNCDEIEKYCNLAYYDSYMTKNCAKTCGKCGTSTSRPETTPTTQRTTTTTQKTTKATTTPQTVTECKDKFSYCSRDSNEKYCNVVAVMATNCPKLCGEC